MRQLRPGVNRYFSHYTDLEEKPIRIHTLREIENDLRVRKVDDENSGDLTAFNKLLAIVGLKHNVENVQEVIHSSVRNTCLVAKSRVPVESTQSG